MEAYQKRVIEEREELADKTAKLAGFIDGAHRTSVFAELPVDEQVRLKVQLAAMFLYLKTLDERIEAFEGE